MKGLCWVCAAVALCASAGGVYADRLPPGPMGYSWAPQRACAYVEIFPPGCRNNPTDRPLCYWYEVGAAAPDFKLDARLLWKGPLANSRMPYEVLLPINGKALVTLNDYGNLGYRNCVVIYDQHGALLKSYALEDLFSEEAIETIPAWNSSRYWNGRAHYTFSPDDRYLYIKTSNEHGAIGEDMVGNVHRCDLMTGEMKIVPKQESRGPDFYEAEVSAFPLRFSSLTDILQCGESEGTHAQE